MSLIKKSITTLLVSERGRITGMDLDELIGALDGMKTGLDFNRAIIEHVLGEMKNNGNVKRSGKRFSLES